MDELVVIKEMHKSQRQWRLATQLSFIAIVLISSFILVVLGREVSGVLIQLVMLLSMVSIAGLIFLDFISFMLNKKFFKQDIMHEYLFKHAKPEDFNKVPEIVVELIKDRRAACQEGEGKRRR